MDENRNNQPSFEEAPPVPQPQTEWAKVQLEIAKVQAQTNSGWQDVITRLADMWQQYSTSKMSGERRYTTTLTLGILVFLSVIVATLAALTLMGIVGGESLVFFLGTLTGSVLMLVAERIRSRE